MTCNHVLAVIFYLLAAGWLGIGYLEIKRGEGWPPLIKTYMLALNAAMLGSLYWGMK